MPRVTTLTPACFVFLIDQSGSMGDPYGTEEGISKAEAVANVMNRIINDMAKNSHKGRGLYKDYFEISVIGYGGKYSHPIDEENSIGSAFGGKIEGKTRLLISEIAQNALRVDERIKKEVNIDTGEIFERPIPFPIWLEPVAGNLTPMCSALKHAHSIITDWATDHPRSHPPFVINITDGSATDCKEGEIESIGEAIKSVETESGTTLIFNVHISSIEGKSITFPSSETDFAHIKSENARYLFTLSSLLTQSMIDLARTKNYDISDGARGFAFNADIRQLIEFLEIGTIISQDTSEQ